MRIVGLHISNVKRVRLVDIEPPDGAFTLGGDNGSGKSTTLDAVAYAIGGARMFSDLQVVRVGESHAEITVDIGDYLITRTWTVADKTTTKLVVTDRHGIPEKRQQELLDSLIGDISFDPLQFANMQAKDQRARLAHLLDLPFDLDEIDGRHAAVFERRKVANRDAKQVEAAFLALPKPLPASGHVPSLADAVAELAAASTVQRAHDDVHRSYADAEDSLGYAQHQRDAAAEALRLADERVEAALARVELTSAAVAALPPDPDVAALAEAVATAERAKDAGREAEVWSVRKAAVADAKAKADALTAELDAIAAEKMAGLQGAVMPIDGLAIGDDGVLYNGLPFSQASASERLRVSMAIGMAANPKLRVLLIRDASLLDEHSMAVVSEMAVDNEFQVWLEVVGDADGRATIVLEDGVIRGAL